jgi:hypothetical protein
MGKASTSKISSWFVVHVLGFEFWILEFETRVRVLSQMCNLNDVSILSSWFSLIRLDILGRNRKISGIWS